MAVDEAARLHALRSLDLLDTPPSESFDRITRMASRIFDLPISAVSLTDTDRQWFRSRVGVDHGSIPRHKAPCAQVAESCTPLVIEDLLADPYYRDSHLARHGIRFYAGVPLVTRDRLGLGAMCVLGTQPRTATSAEIASLTDLAAMVMSQIELQHAFGRVDPVSNLSNRNQLLEDLDDLALERGAGEVRFVTVVDLISSEQINHAVRVMGRCAIEDMVKTAARNLTAMIGHHRKAYQVGPTQLAIVSLPDLTEAGYLEMLSALTPRMMALGEFDRMGVVAIGAAPFTLGRMRPDDALQAAQGAAQDARLSGRFFSFYSTEQDGVHRRSWKLLRDFEAALQDKAQLRLVYQPRIDLASGRCVGAEALMRWRHPSLGWVSPSEFIPLIELTALAGPTTAWVVETAVAQLVRWRAVGIDLQLSVNVSTTNLHEDDFAGSILRLLDRHGLPASALELEITETAIMNDAGRALTQLEILAGAGLRLAIDDFGTGYSSLSYLQRLPVQVVKIDRSFMQEFGTNDRQTSLVTMMIAMSKHLGHRVVAEGVETEEVLAQLRATSCDEVQGYLFAKPMPAAAFEQWFHEHRP